LNYLHRGGIQIFHHQTANKPGRELEPTLEVLVHSTALHTKIDPPLPVFWAFSSKYILAGIHPRVTVPAPLDLGNGALQAPPNSWRA